MKRSRLAAVAALGAAIVALGLLFQRLDTSPRGARTPGRPAEPVTMTPARSLDLVRIKDRTLAKLENGQYEEALPGLAELARAVPDERLVWRDLAVLTLAALREGVPVPAAPVAAVLGQAGGATGFEALARAAADKLLGVEAGAPEAYWLAGHTALVLAERGPVDERTASLAAALQTFDRALQRFPDDVTLNYALYSATLSAADPALRTRGLDALAKAHALQPDNLILLAHHLTAQAKAQDPGLARTLARAAALLESLREGIQLRANVDVVRHAADTTAAVRGRHWAAAQRAANVLRNVLIPTDAAQSDRRRLEPHPLAFLVHDFSADYYRGHQPAAPPPPDAVPVRLTPLPGPTGVGEVHDLRLADMDLDGRLDLVLLADGAVQVLARVGDEGAWKRVAAAPVPRGMRGLRVADLDRVAAPPAARREDDCQDTPPAVVVYGERGVRLFRNRLPSGGELEPVAPDRALAALTQVDAVLALDFDHDGDLDLITAGADGLRLASNRGDLTFSDVSGWSRLPPASVRVSSLVAVDWDRDVDIDVLAGGPGQTLVLENLRHGEFRWQPLDLLEPRAVSALRVVDADGNASWDLIAGGPDGVVLLRTRTAPPGPVRRLAVVTPSPQPSTGLLTWDYDNDGYEDLLSWSASGVEVLRGGPGGELEPARTLTAAWPAGVRAVDAGDLDHDGDLDLALATSGGVVLLENQGGNRNRWLQVRARGQPDDVSGRVNRHGVGSLVEVKAGGHYQARVVDGPVTHFGLGSHARADVVRLLFTNGIAQTALDAAAGLRLCEPMRLKGSCPYLYAWSGEEYAFVTDLLWAAPLGLQLAPGQLMPARPWEYLKIPGTALKPRAGHYELRITEELWEAAYFDAVQLLAVDHPADVEVYTNEKVGPASLAAFRLHTVRNPRTPVAARNHRGRDVLAEVRERDGRYLGAFDRTLRQGLAEPHFLELDLGPLASRDRPMLFLTGWIRPTDTSINIALAQDPRLEGPRPPSLHVPDGRGGWREALPFMGFPGGKTKTIAVDLAGLLPPDDHRVRIVTSAELYWDHVFFTVGEPPARYALTALTLESAELRYRGSSEAVPGRGRGPETYRYDRVAVGPVWPPMGGYFTRYGDVRELVTRADDRLVVMGAGDEIVLRFRAPAAEPPPGWKRDFVLHNVGWDKDADLNTVYGQHAEPLPFGRMTTYPNAPLERPAPESGSGEDVADDRVRAQPPHRFWNRVRFHGE